MIKNQWAILFAFLLLFSLFFLGKNSRGAFYRFSMDQMERFFLSPEVQEIFGVEKEDAVAVFRSENQEVLL